MCLWGETEGPNLISISCFRKIFASQNFYTCLQYPFFLCLRNMCEFVCVNVFYGATYRPGLGNDRPAGHIRPAKHLNVARELHLKFSK